MAHTWLESFEIKELMRQCPWQAGLDQQLVPPGWGIALTRTNSRGLRSCCSNSASPVSVGRSRLYGDDSTECPTEFEHCMFEEEWSCP